MLFNRSTADCETPRKLFAYLIMAALALAFLATPTSGMAEDLDRWQLRAFYLMSFAYFTDWPAGDDSLKIGLLGDNSDLLHAALTRRASSNARRIKAFLESNGRRIKISKCRTAEEAADCHIVYISISSKDRCAEVLEKLKAKPMITVGERKEFEELGGVLSFKEESPSDRDTTLHFWYNPRHIQRLQHDKIKIQSGFLHQAGIPF